MYKFYNYKFISRKDCKKNRLKNAKNSFILNFFLNMSSNKYNKGEQ